MDNIEQIKKEREQFLKKEIKKGKKRTTWTPNDILVYDTYAEVILRNPKQKIKGIAIIDNKDVELIKQYKWHLHPTGYASTHYNQKQATMHRLLFDFPNGMIDHINRNKLNNRRMNLRMITPKGSTQNRTTIKEKDARIFKVESKVNVKKKV